MTKKEIKDYLIRLHRSAFRNEKQIRNSRICGCFYCGSILKPEDIVEWLDDDWTVVAEDGRPSAHYENTILITDGEPEILTLL